MRLLAGLLAAALLVAPALAEDAVPTQEAALALLDAGKREEALRAFQRIIASHPRDPTETLFWASRTALELDRWQVAQPYVRQLVALQPGSMAAWELQVQVDQAANDPVDQQSALDSLYSAWRSALDPNVQKRVAFIRDRIFGPRHTLVVQQTLDPGGDDIVRWLFQPMEDAGRSTHYLIVRSDNDTNERWRDAGTVSYGTIVYHLDAVRVLPNGMSQFTPYAFYLNDPDYARVRATVAAILTGEARPQTGEADPFWTAAPAQP